MHSDIGMLPPQAVDVETKVLGQLMIDSYAYDRVIGKINEGCFYKESNRAIFKAIKSLYDRNVAIDVLTVVQELISHKSLERIGGPIIVSELSLKVSSAMNIEVHVQILTEHFMRREVIRMSQEAIAMAYDNSKAISDTLDKFQNDALNIGAEFSTRKEEHVYESMTNFVKKVTSPSEVKSFVPVPIKKLSDCINGFGNSQFIILAARPAHGKSSLMLDIMKSQAKQGIPVVLFSLEMSKEQLAGRIHTVETGISINALDKGSLSSDEINKIERAADKYRDVPLFIDDTPAINYLELKAKARRMIKQKGVKCIYVDYLGLMTGDKTLKHNKSVYVGDISNNLKQIALELDIPIVALSQLNRSIESRPLQEQTGRLSDLKDSGDIEQDADIVIFLTNPEKIDMETYNGESTAGKAIIDIAKNRNGATESFFIGKHVNNMSWGDSVGGEGELPF